MDALLPEDMARVEFLYTKLYSKYRARECFLFLMKTALDHYEKSQKEVLR